MNALSKDPSRFVETAIEDETLIMLLETGDFFSLKGTARDIWELLDGSLDRDRIVASLAESYGTSPGEIGPEVDAFLAQLSGAGLLQSG